MSHVIYEIDGRRVQALEDFTALAGQAVGGPGTYFGSSNLAAFADCLSGGFGTPEDGDFAFRIADSLAARAGLGYQATLAWLQWGLPAVHRSNEKAWNRRIRDATAGIGPTLFDQVVEIFFERGVPLHLD